MSPYPTILLHQPFLLCSCESIKKGELDKEGKTTSIAEKEKGLKNAINSGQLMGNMQRSLIADENRSEVSAMIETCTGSLIQMKKDTSEQDKFLVQEILTSQRMKMWDRRLQNPLVILQKEANEMKEIRNQERYATVMNQLKKEQNYREQLSKAPHTTGPSAAPSDNCSR